MPAVLRLFWTPPGGQEAPVPAGAYTYLPPLIEVRGDGGVVDAAADVPLATASVFQVQGVKIDAR